MVSLWESDGAGFGGAGRVVGALRGCVAWVVFGMAGVGGVWEVVGGVWVVVFGAMVSGMAGVGGFWVVGCFVVGWVVGGLAKVSCKPKKHDSTKKAIVHEGQAHGEKGWFGVCVSLCILGGLSCVCAVMLRFLDLWGWYAAFVARCQSWK